ncbi:TPA: hypothetical protein ACIO5U_001780 [Streptococcus pyogenes]
MKKTLTLLLALFAIGVTSSVRAEDEIKWELDPDTSPAIHVTISPENGTNKLHFTLPKGWSVSFKKKDSSANKSYSPVKINDKSLSEYCKPQHNNGTQGTKNTSPKVITSDSETNHCKLSFIYNDNHGDGGLPITVTVDKPNEGDELTLLYRADDGFFWRIYKIKRFSNTKKRKREKRKTASRRKTN